MSSATTVFVVAGSSAGPYSIVGADSAVEVRHDTDMDVGEPVSAKCICGVAAASTAVDTDIHNIDESTTRGAEQDGLDCKKSSFVLFYDQFEPECSAHLL